MSDSDKRRSFRFPIKGGSVQYKEAGGLFAFLKGSSERYPIINLSSTGLRFLTTDTLLIGDKMTFVIGIPTLGGEPLSADGRVTWVQRSNRYKANVIGVQFTAMTKDSIARLKNLVAFMGRKIRVRSRIKVQFSEEMRKQPTLWEIARDFDVKVNLLKGSMTDVATWLEMEIEGEKEEVRRVIKHLQEHGAKIAPLK
ncbi:MAG: PilZ domain-containing protein [Candidatus Brocadiia bacterium]